MSNAVAAVDLQSGTLERGQQWDVLDYGYVRYISHMGSDEDIVETARMSTGRGFISWDPYKRCRRCEAATADLTQPRCKNMLQRIDLQEPQFVQCPSEDFESFPRGDFGMLDSLYKNKHSTPFEFGELTIEVQAPIMVFREWHRHRTQSYSEFSARYAQMPNLHYLPAVGRFQKQSKTNKQGSAEAMDDVFARNARDQLQMEQTGVWVTYDKLVEAGLAKEVARLNTPVSRYSRMRAKTDLRNWLAFAILRKKSKQSNPQWEIAQYADIICDNILKVIFPKTYFLFEEHDLFGTRLSRTESQQLRELLQHYQQLAPADDHHARKVKQLLERLG